MSADILLARLERVRKRTGDQWSARCPAHDDKGPSLSVRELPDGRVLLYCFAGCDAGDVVAAVGLDLADLFPTDPAHLVAGSGPQKRRRLITAGQALEVLEFETTLVFLAANNLANGHALTSDDLARLNVAAQRVGELCDEVRR